MNRLELGAKKVSLWVFLGLLAYMPLHIFLSTWLGTTFGALEFAKIAKDIVLVLGFMAVAIASVRQVWLKRFFTDKLVWVIAAYGVFTVLMALTHNTQQSAEVLGVVYNLRFLVFFLYGMLLYKLYDGEQVFQKAVKVALISGAIVGLFGVVQYTVLPDDALTHVGYSRENGVLPAFFIDDKPDLERVMSTVRDPNSLASYLVIIALLGMAGWLAHKNKRIKLFFTGVILLSLLSILLSFSRSGWLGLILGIGVFTAGYLLNKYSFKGLIKKYKWWFISSTTALVLAAFALFAFKDSYLVQNVILHADQSTQLEDPNELRLRFWQESLQAGIEQPFGYGPGTAGLASIRNTEQGTILNENYYLQILHEVGIIGLVLFLAVIGLLLARLWKVFRQQNNLWALALFASLIGLCFTNFLVHIWSNEAVAYTFWGLAGLLVLSKINTKKKRV